MVKALPCYLSSEKMHKSSNYNSPLVFLVIRIPISSLSYLLESEALSQKEFLPSWVGFRLPRPADIFSWPPLAWTPFHKVLPTWNKCQHWLSVVPPAGPRLQ